MCHHPTDIRSTKPGPDPTPLPREPRLKTPVPAGALQQYTETVDLELGAAIAMLNTKLDSSMETALRELNLQRPNSNVKSQLAHVGINAGLIETYSNILQDILEQLHPIAKGILPYTAQRLMACVISCPVCPTKCDGLALIALTVAYTKNNASKVQCTCL